MRQSNEESKVVSRISSVNPLGSAHSEPNVIGNADENGMSGHSNSSFQEVTGQRKGKMPTRKDHKKKVTEKFSKLVIDGISDTEAMIAGKENKGPENEQMQ